MRKPAGWMTKADERILEFLQEEGNHQPSHMAHLMPDEGADLDFHRNYLGRRCRELANAGLLVNIGNGVYTITDKGEAFLAGELDAATLEEPDSD